MNVLVVFAVTGVLALGVVVGAFLRLREQSKLRVTVQTLHVTVQALEVSYQRFESLLSDLENNIGEADEEEARTAANVAQDSLAENLVAAQGLSRATLNEAERTELKTEIQELLEKESVPAGFQWVGNLTADHYVEFRARLNDACRGVNWDSVRVLVEGWRMAARVDSDENLQESLLKERDPSEYQRMPHPSEYRKQMEKTSQG